MQITLVGFLKCDDFTGVGDILYNVVIYRCRRYSLQCNAICILGCSLYLTNTVLITDHQF